MQPEGRVRRAHCSCSCQEHSTAARNTTEPMAGRTRERSLLCSRALSEAAMSTGTTVPVRSSGDQMTRVESSMMQVYEYTVHQPGFVGGYDVAFPSAIACLTPAHVCSIVDGWAGLNTSGSCHLIGLDRAAMQSRQLNPSRSPDDREVFSSPSRPPWGGTQMSTACANA